MEGCMRLIEPVAPPAVSRSAVGFKQGTQSKASPVFWTRDCAGKSGCRVQKFGVGVRVVGFRAV